LFPFIVLAAACGATETLFGQEDSSAAEIGSPVGVWSCVLYERLTPDNDYVLMRFDPGGTTHLARPRSDGFRVWAPASAWTARRKQLSFSDSRTGREFEADLRRSGLGGTWKAGTSNGGWWCARLDAAVADWQDVGSLTSYDVMPPLIPYGVSTPYYPLGALRKAQEGRAAVCFLVESTGTIVQPELIEISDDIFRQTALRAVMASKYRGWTGEPAVRPGCRTFNFELDPIE
jgi:hypothetical protein